MKWLLFKWADLIEWIKGSGQIQEIYYPRAFIETLDAHSILGYVATIHCQERRYLKTYHRWFIPDQIFSSYDVFATVTGPAPSILVQNASMTRSFPKLKNKWAGSRRQKQAAIEAYIDLLVYHVEQARQK